MIKLDGSHGEGGGALVRTALALSTLTKKAFQVNNIRAGRSKPGLKAQHLAAIKMLKPFCDAYADGDELGSQNLEYIPRTIKGGKYEIDIKTAGSITLLLQSIILPAMFAPSKVTLTVKGGTCGKWQASVDYLQNVLLPHLEKFTEKIKLSIIKRGYFPAGGGEIILEISPKFKLKQYEAFSLFYEDIQRIPKIKLIEQGDLQQIRGVANLSRELADREIAERIKKAAEVSLREFNIPASVRMEYVKALSTGGDLLLWSIHNEEGFIHPDNPVILGADSLLDTKKSAEQVGKEAAHKLKDLIHSNAAVDSHLADQLIPFMGLLPGSTIVTNEVTEHTRTNIHITEQFLPVAFKIEGNTIICQSKD